MNDIRVVYDLSQCGLDRVVWAPNFPFPTIDTTFRSMESTAVYGDIDTKKFFLNFQLDQKLIPFCGIDVIDLVVSSDENETVKRI